MVKKYIEIDDEQILDAAAEIMMYDIKIDTIRPATQLDFDLLLALNELDGAFRRLRNKLHERNPMPDHLLRAARAFIAKLNEVERALHKEGNL